MGLWQTMPSCICTTAMTLPSDSVY